MKTRASSEARSMTRNAARNGGAPPSSLATSVVGAMRETSRARCQARIPGPAMRSPTTSGVATTTVDIAGSVSLDAIEVDAAAGDLQVDTAAVGDGDRSGAVFIASRRQSIAPAAESDRNGLTRCVVKLRVTLARLE